MYRMPGGFQGADRNDYGYRLLRVEQRALQRKFNDRLLVQHRVYRAGHGGLERPVQCLSPGHVQGLEWNCELQSLSAQLEFVGW